MNNHGRSEENKDYLENLFLPSFYKNAELSSKIHNSIEIKNSDKNVKNSVLFFKNLNDNLQPIQKVTKISNNTNVLPLCKQLNIQTLSFDALNNHLIKHKNTCKVCEASKSLTSIDILKRIEIYKKSSEFREI